MPENSPNNAKSIFQPGDAHRNLRNITDEQALLWVKIATEDYERRIKMGAGEGIARGLAQKTANVKVIGKRCYTFNSKAKFGRQA